MYDFEYLGHLCIVGLSKYCHDPWFMSCFIFYYLIVDKKSLLFLVAKLEGCSWERIVFFLNM